MMAVSIELQAWALHMQLQGAAAYPKHENAMYGCEKAFNIALAKDLSQHRLNG